MLKLPELNDGTGFKFLHHLQQSLTLIAKSVSRTMLCENLHVTRRGHVICRLGRSPRLLAWSVAGRSVGRSVARSVARSPGRLAKPLYMEVVFYIGKWH